MLTEPQARDEIVRVGKSLFERGYVHSTAGNISVRCAGGYVMTPTDACLGFLDAERLSLLKENFEQISGDRVSKTVRLHQAIYQATQTSCVIHTHSSHCVALSFDESRAELLDAVTPYFVMKVGHVPLISYTRPGGPQAVEAAQHLIARYAKQGIALRAIMFARLGPNVWHDSPAQAMATLEELEETAKLVCLSKASPKPLSEAKIAELCETFKAQW
jgi:3-dehydro-4-phosphotetronate decarboxylase